MMPRLLQVHLADPRSRRVAQAIGALWILSVADLVLTLWAHVFTPLIEMNPLAGVMLDLGVAPLIFFKLTTLTIGTAIFWGLRRYTRCELMLWGLVAVYLLLAIRWSDYTSEAIASIHV